jgi:hypothetical protein
MNCEQVANQRRHLGAYKSELIHPLLQKKVHVFALVWRLLICWLILSVAPSMMTKEGGEKEKLIVPPNGVSSRQEFRCLM